MVIANVSASASVDAILKDLNVLKTQVVRASAYHLLVATQTLVKMDHVLLVGLIGEWAAIPRKEQHASMNHLLAQTVLESALQEHAYATQSAAMAFQISKKPARAVLRMFSARTERSAAQMEAAKSRAEAADNAAMAWWMTVRSANQIAIVLRENTAPPVANVPE